MKWAILDRMLRKRAPESIPVPDPEPNAFYLESGADRAMLAYTLAAMNMEAMEPGDDPEAQREVLIHTLAHGASSWALPDNGNPMIPDGEDSLFIFSWLKDTVIGPSY